jgi:hypothetical protein
MLIQIADRLIQTDSISTIEKSERDGQLYLAVSCGHTFFSLKGAEAQTLWDWFTTPQGDHRFPLATNLVIKNQPTTAEEADPRLVEIH